MQAASPVAMLNREADCIAANRCRSQNDGICEKRRSQIAKIGPVKWFETPRISMREALEE